MLKFVCASLLLLTWTQVARAGCRPCGNDSFCCTESACNRCGSGFSEWRLPVNVNVAVPEKIYTTTVKLLPHQAHGISGFTRESGSQLTVNK